MFEIFKSFREFGFDVTSKSFINIVAPLETVGPNYCSNSSIVGSSINALIDGNESTAWATYQRDDPTQQYIVLEFLQQPIYVNTFYFYSLCSPPM